MLEAVALRSIDGCHLDGLERIESQFYSSSDVVYDMTLSEDIFYVLIVGAETEVLGINACPDDAAYDIIDIVCGRSLTDMDMYALPVLPR